MKKIRLILYCSLVALCASISASAQNIVWDTLSTEIVQGKPKELFVGANYSYTISNVMFSPTIKAKPRYAPINFGALCTYYTPLWGYMDYFGFQTGIKYTSLGYYSNEPGFEYLHDELQSVQIPITTLVKFDIQERFRALFTIGTLVGYRTSTNKEGGFDCFDRRWDYGLEAGLAFVVRLNPIELHLGGSYQYNLSWFYHPEKLDSDIWVYAFPTVISINFGVHFKLK